MNFSWLSKNIYFKLGLPNLSYIDSVVVSVKYGKGCVTKSGLRCNMGCEVHEKDMFESTFIKTK